MGDKPKILGATGGAVALSALALAFGACCVAPWAVALLGVGGAVMLARLAGLQSAVVIGTLLLLGLGFWYAYRRRPAANGEACPVEGHRGVRIAVWVGALIVVCIDIASYVPRFASISDSDAAPANIGYTVLGSDTQLLQTDFNRDRGDVRLMFLVDPICPGCLRGLADMGDELLSKLPAGAPVKVYVVFEPVIGGRSKDIPAAAALLRSPSARLFWNPTGDFGREMSHALGYWNGYRWVYAWDTWLIYPPDAVWSGATPPAPAFLMHQLGGLPHTPQFPHLDARVFAAKVQGMIDGRDRPAVPE